MKLLSPLYVLTALAGLHVLAAPSLPDRQLDEIAARDIASTILHEIETAVTCAACETVLLALKGLADLGNSVFVSVLTEICILSKAEDADVCTGIIASEGPILAHDLRDVNIGSKTSVLFCITLLGLCSYPAVTPYTISFPKPKPNTSRPPPSGKTPLQVVHISDTHVDLSYETGASTNCTKPICCRPYTPADAPGANSNPAGPYGDHNCDAPLRLEESMLAAIEGLEPKPAFTIFTGDVVAHDIWLVNQNEVETDLNATYSRMLGLNLVYPVVGNHDTAPVNAFPPTAIDTTLTASWAYDTMAADWYTWIGAVAAKSVEATGAYSVLYPGGNLRVISFNSIFYYRLNFWLYEEPMELDPSGQFAWLVKELQGAEDAGERVWLISHVPSGSSDFFHDFSAYFDQIIQRYDATIAALFYGHTHQDQFEIAYSDYTKQTFSNAVAMSYIAPSMTPTSGSPAFRVYSVDPVTFGVLDFTQYFADIKSPSYQTNPTWTKYYSAKETYGSLLTPPLTSASAELTPAFWHNVTAAFASNDAAFQAYYARKTRGYDGTSCVGACKTTELCELRAAQSQYNCGVIAPGIHFSKRGDGGVMEQRGDHSDECEGSRIRSIFGIIAQDHEEFARRINSEVERRSCCVR